MGFAHFLQVLWWSASLGLCISLRAWGFGESRAGRLIGSENEWTVGQILSLFLILLPVLSAVEVYFAKYVNFLCLEAYYTLQILNCPWRKENDTMRSMLEHQ